MNYIRRPDATLEILFRQFVFHGKVQCIIVATLSFETDRHGSVGFHLLSIIVILMHLLKLMLHPKNLLALLLPVIFDVAIDYLLCNISQRAYLSLIVYQIWLQKLAEL